jgi:hypothetical protein
VRHKTIGSPRSALAEAKQRSLLNDFVLKWLLVLAEGLYRW